MPIAERAPRRERESNPQRIVVYAGTSERRKAFVKAVNETAGIDFTGIFKNVPAGEEPDISDTVAIMLRKIMVAGETIAEKKMAKPKDTVIIIAADIRTRIGPSRSNKGKPKEPEEVRRTFQRMARSEHPYYSVESSSGVRINNRHPLVTADNTTILLDPDGVKNFSMPEGFADYQQRFNAYYSSPVYLNDGNHAPVEVTDLAAGLSLPILLSSHSVLEINGITPDNPDFHKAVKMALYNVAIGFNLDLLKNVWPNVKQFVDKYPWLVNATAFSLGKGVKSA